MVPNGSIKENRRVLLIENSQTDRLLLRNWLTADRIEVYDAVDIITGLAGCSRFQPNLILVQIRLPTWDGYEVIRRLKHDHRTLSIPVILLAPSATTAEKAKGIDMGAVDFIPPSLSTRSSCSRGSTPRCGPRLTSTCSSSGHTSTG